LIRVQVTFRCTNLASCISWEYRYNYTVYHFKCKKSTPFRNMPCWIFRAHGFGNIWWICDLNPSLLHFACIIFE